METAQSLAKNRNLRVIPCEAVNEVDFGQWVGKTWAELQASPVWRGFNERRSVVAPPGGELMLAIQVRVIQGMERMRERHPDQHVAIVSHGDVIRSAVAHVAGIPLDLLDRIEISLGSFSTVEWYEDGPRLLRLNSTADL
jgi:broad specificity phosphatase PhoE